MSDIGRALLRPYLPEDIESWPLRDQVGAWLGAAMRRRADYDLTFLWPPGPDGPYCFHPRPPIWKRLINQYLFRYTEVRPGPQESIL